MRNNPYSNEPTRAPSAETLPQRERMEDLPPRQMPPQMSPPPVVEPSPEVEDVEIRQEEVRTIRYAIEKLNDFLQWFLVVMEVTLAIRFFFKLIGASQANLFAGFLYALTDIVLIPFANIVRSPSISPGQAFEWSTLIAMIIYWLIFWAIRRFLSILVSTPEEPEV
jgi:hypothetical protein